MLRTKEESHLGWNRGTPICSLQLCAAVTLPGRCLADLKVGMYHLTVPFNFPFMYPNKMRHFLPCHKPCPQVKHLPHISFIKEQEKIIMLHLQRRHQSPAELDLMTAQWWDGGKLGTGRSPSPFLWAALHTNEEYQVLAHGDLSQMAHRRYEAPS